MKDCIFTVCSNKIIAKNIYEMKLQGDVEDFTAPGQFVNILVDGCFLRRPISVCDIEKNELTLIYKVVGKGTEIMSQYEKGKELSLLTGLGNGFDINVETEKPLLIGGGVGVPPMFMLCKKLLKKGIKPTVVLGFGTENECFYKSEFENLGVKTIVTTVDGSLGVKGFVTDAMKTIDYDYFFTCGPMPMFKAIEQVAKSSGQFSFEEKMGCGFGACMGCSCKTKYGNKRICKDGPVLKREEIIW